MRLGDAVAWHMDVLDRPHLEHDFVDHIGGCALVDVAYVDGGIFILLPVRKGVSSEDLGVKCEEASGWTYQCLFCAILSM